MEKIRLLGRKHLGMGPPLRISELKHGGLISGEAEGCWIDFFKDMVSGGPTDIGNVMQMKALWFCFEAALQNELDKVKQN